MSEKLPLGLIRTDGGTQPRAELSKAVIEEYTAEMRRGAEFPPVVVFHDGAEYWLADGFHRVNARKGTAYGDITVDIRQGTKRDAILHSLGANAIHGIRRTNEDKRRAVERMLSDPEWAAWSDREIARQCEVSDRFVNQQRAQVPSANGSQIEQPRTVSRGRATYTMNTAGLKRSAETARSSGKNKNKGRGGSGKGKTGLRLVPEAEVASDGRRARLSRFYLSLRSTFDMINELGQEPHELLDYAAQNRTVFDPHVTLRVANFLSELAALMEADRAAKIRAEEARQ